MILDLIAWLFVSGPGSSDNHRFVIVQDQLKITFILITRFNLFIKFV